MVGADWKEKRKGFQAAREWGTEAKDCVPSCAPTDHVPHFKLLCAICKMCLMLEKDTEWVRLYPSGGEVECSCNCQVCALGGTNPRLEKSRERKVILFL